MTRFLKQTYWHELFEAGIAFKAINSVWEIAGGIALLTHAHSFLTRLVLYLNGVPLFDHDDRWFVLLNAQLAHLAAPSTRLFVGFYLFFHGCMNVFLAYNLYRNRLWAYPTMVGFVLLFFLYQIYRLAHTHSPVLVVVSLVDIAFVVLTWHEYQYQIHKRRTTLA
jgi:uncharacterized membrane protein